MYAFGRRMAGPGVELWLTVEYKTEVVIKCFWIT